jgi:hypothetical protein
MTNYQRFMESTLGEVSPDGQPTYQNSEDVITDILVENHGSIMLFRPVTEAGTEWLAEHTPCDEDHQYFGPALCVEPRYAESLVEGMVGDGLNVG